MKIAVAGKLTRADAFKNLRTMGYPIISRWIDIQANDAIVEDKAALWDICLKDASDCDIFFLYLGDHDKPHFGTMLEMGHAMAAGAVVYVINSCACYEESPSSRKEALCHDRVHRITSNQHINSEDGMSQAMEHYNRKYNNQEVAA